VAGGSTAAPRHRYELVVTVLGGQTVLVVTVRGGQTVPVREKEAISSPNVVWRTSCKALAR